MRKIVYYLLFIIGICFVTNIYANSYANQPPPSEQTMKEIRNMSNMPGPDLRNGVQPPSEDYSALKSAGREPPGEGTGGGGPVGGGEGGYLALETVPFISVLLVTVIYVIYRKRSHIVKDKNNTN